jgi:hypothetical protein
MAVSGKSIIGGPVGIGTSSPRVMLDINNTDAIHIPVGTTAQRPTTTNEATHGGYIRYNSENHQFEGYGPGNAWGSLGGVINVAQNTKIMASSPNADSTNNDLMFFTAPIGNTTAGAAVERMRIDGSGNVGIATSSPVNKLDVEGAVAIGASYSGSVTAPANGLIVQGGVCIGKTTLSANYILDITGNVQATSYNATSDIRLKTNIQSLSGSLDVVNQLNGVSFTWKSDTTNKPVLGLIAQDVEKVLPEIVNTADIDNEDGYKQKSIHYDGLFPHLIESIKTLTQENKSLVSKVDVLKQENKDLVAKVDKIMTILEKLNISV